MQTKSLTLPLPVSESTHDLSNGQIAQLSLAQATRATVPGPPGSGREMLQGLI
jgi:hypothetical protein